MALRVNPAWMSKMKSKIETLGRIDSDSDHINEIISFNKATQWLITRLAEKRIPFKLKSLGAGVKMVTTIDVDKCPYCNKKL